MHYEKPMFTTIVVDDEALIRMNIRDVLEGMKCKVLEASHVIQALQILETTSLIDLIVTDVQMPGPLDGLHFLEVARRIYPDIPVLVTSGKAVTEDALSRGASGFLQKPYSVVALQHAVAAARTPQTT